MYIAISLRNEMDLCKFMSVCTRVVFANSVTIINRPTVNTMLSKNSLAVKKVRGQSEATKYICYKSTGFSAKIFHVRRSFNASVFVLKDML